MVRSDRPRILQRARIGKSSIMAECEQLTKLKKSTHVARKYIELFQKAVPSEDGQPLKVVVCWRCPHCDDEKKFVSFNRCQARLSGNAVLALGNSCQACTAVPEEISSILKADLNAN